MGMSFDTCLNEQLPKLVVFVLDVAQRGEMPLSAHELSRVSAAPYDLRFATGGGGGFSSAILSKASAWVAWGPVTNVPLILVVYHPETTPSRSASSGLTCRDDSSFVVISSMHSPPVPAERLNEVSGSIVRGKQSRWKT
jgi:hypothetical protein